MKYIIFFLFIAFYYPSFGQLNPSNIYQLIENPLDKVSGVYQIKEWILYDKDEITLVNPYQPKLYINTAESFNALNVKNNKIYFTIKENGNYLTITDEYQSYSNVVAKSLLDANEFDLKLYSKTDKNSTVIYKIVKLKKIDDVFDKIVQGTGVIISKTGYVITNSHVINEANLIKIQLGTVSYNASVIYNDTENDIAFMPLSVFPKKDSSFIKPHTAVVWCSCGWFCSSAITNNPKECIN